MNAEERARIAEARAHLKKTTQGYLMPDGSPRMRVGDHMRKALALLEFAPPAPPPPPGPPPVPTVRLAPRSYNLGSNDSDPRFAVFSSPGVLNAGLRQVGSDVYEDQGGFQYNGDGMNVGGAWRTRDRIVPGLKPANEMDGRSGSDPYEKDGRQFPPWPDESYLP